MSCEPARRLPLMQPAATLLALWADAHYTSQSKGGSAMHASCLIHGKKSDAYISSYATFLHVMEGNRDIEIALRRSRT